ncbi:MAG: NADH-quinone oxidoreductase subunit L, partial [Acidobacteria bacterium]|nr:NADH-quinone oxidoreductase subunit L [Acidobacteriota bacterium]
RESVGTSHTGKLADVSPRSHERSYDAHESPPVMTIPLAVLAACTILLSVLGTPAWPWLEGYLSGHAATFDFSRLLESSTLNTMLLSLVVVALGIGAAWWMYGKPASRLAETDPLARIQPGLFTILANKFYIDEFYRASVIRLTDALGWCAHLLDRFVWGGIVKVVSLITLGVSWLNRFIDEYIVNLGFDGSCESVRRSSGFMASLQSGQVQKYLRVIGVALTALLLLLLWGCSR